MSCCCEPPSVTTDLTEIMTDGWLIRVGASSLIPPSNITTHHLQSSRSVLRSDVFSDNVYHLPPQTAGIRDGHSQLWRPVRCSGRAVMCCLQFVRHRQYTIHSIETAHIYHSFLFALDFYQERCQVIRILVSTGLSCEGRGGGGVMTRCLAHRDSISAIWSSTKLRMSDKW